MNRRALLALSLFGLLASCGHGSPAAIPPPGAIPAPAISAFTATPTGVTGGAAASLAYAFTGGNGNIDQGVGAITSGSATSVTPATSTTYTLTVTNAGGVSVIAHATVAVVGTPTSYAVTYNGNGNTGGTPPSDNGRYATGAAVTVLGNTSGLTRAGYSFAGWNTRADGTGTSEAAGATLVMGTADVTLQATWSAQVGTASWTAFMTSVQTGVYTSMAVAANHDLFITSALNFTVYKSNSQTAAALVALPSTGMTLTGAQFFKITTNSLNEPVVGVFAGANHTQNAPTNPLIFRFNSSTNQWVAATINTGVWPNLGIFDIKTAPDGTIWAGVKWGSWILKSTDNGSSFTSYDLNTALPASGHADYFPIYVGNGTTSNSVGATYSVGISPGNVVYTATETGSLFYSADQGASWHPVSLDYTNPNSKMVRTMTGNSAGLGFTADHKVMLFGRGRTLYNSSNQVTALNSDGNFLVLVDQAAQTTVNGAINLPPYSWASGLECSRIVTLANGQLLLHSDKAISGSQWGMYASSDDGKSWQPFNTGITTAFDLNQTSSLVADGKSVFVLASGTIWKYTAP
jgi:uncharacterized repeat protein (TIGR02543 family)